MRGGGGDYREVGIQCQVIGERCKWGPGTKKVRSVQG